MRLELIGRNLIIWFFFLHSFHFLEKFNSYFYALYSSLNSNQSRVFLTLTFNSKTYFAYSTSPSDPRLQFCESESFSNPLPFSRHWAASISRSLNIFIFLIFNYPVNLTLFAYRISRFCCCCCRFYYYFSITSICRQQKRNTETQNAKLRV